MLETVNIAKIFKALCDENRIEIIKLLQEGQMCACHIAEQLSLAQSKLSYHMKILCESGLVDSSESGKWTYYSLSKSGRKTAISTLKTLTKQNKKSKASFCDDVS